MSECVITAMTVKTKSTTWQLADRNLFMRLASVTNILLQTIAARVRQYLQLYDNKENVAIMNKCQSIMYGWLCLECDSMMEH